MATEWKFSLFFDHSIRSSVFSPPSHRLSLRKTLMMMVHWLLVCENLCRFNFIRNFQLIQDCIFLGCQRQKVIFTIKHKHTQTQIQTPANTQTHTITVCGSKNFPSKHRFPKLRGTRKQREGGAEGWQNVSRFKVSFRKSFSKVFPLLLQISSVLLRELFFQ